MSMFMMELSFPFVRTFPVMFFVHVSLMMPWIIVVTEPMSIPMMIEMMWVVLPFKVFWNKTVMNKIIWVLMVVMLPMMSMMVIIMTEFIIMMVSMMFTWVCSKMFSMVFTMWTVLKVKFFIFFIKMGKVMVSVISMMAIFMPVSESMPLIMTPMAVAMVIRMSWVMHWLSFFWSPVHISISMVVIIIMIIWFHFQYKVSTVNECLR